MPNGPDGSDSSTSDDDDDDEKGTSRGRGSIANGGTKRRHVAKSPTSRPAKRVATMSGETLRELEDAQGGSEWGKEEIEKWSAGVQRKKRKKI